MKNKEKNQAHEELPCGTLKIFYSTGLCIDLPAQCPVGPYNRQLQLQDRQMWSLDSKPLMEVDPLVRP